MPDATALAASLADGGEITPICGAPWTAFHLYAADGAGLPEVLLQVVLPAVGSFLADREIDSFFFIRYADEEGPHVRLRLRVPGGGGSAHACRRRLEALAGSAARVAAHSFEPETERYGGEAALPWSLAFFAVSSANALAFEQQFGDRPRGRRLTLSLCVLLWQAWGLARSRSELCALLDYYAVGPQQHPEAAALAEAGFHSGRADLSGLLGGELERLLALGRGDPASPPALTSAAAMALAARAFDACLDDLPAAARWSTLSSQMHMTANRLGLVNAEETYVTRLLGSALGRIESASPELWQRVEAALTRRRPAPRGPAARPRRAPAAALEKAVRRHLAEIGAAGQRPPPEA